MRNLVAMTGKAGAGKTTLANYLVNHYGYVKFSFATALKQLLWEAYGNSDISTGLIVSKVQDYSTSYGLKSGRELMQQFGTLFREQIDADFWIKIVDNKIARYERDKMYQPDIVIDDLRFMNEAEWVCRHNGIIIRLEDAPHTVRTEEWNKHISEMEQDSIRSNIIVAHSITEPMEKFYYSFAKEMLEHDLARFLPITK